MRSLSQHAERDGLDSDYQSTRVTPTILYPCGSQAALAYLNITRFVAGIGVGVVSPVVPTYISESSPKEIRGRLTGMYQLFLVFGIAGSFWTNYGLFEYFGDDPKKEALWQVAFGLQAIPGIFLLYSMAFQYESPRWLAEQGRFDQMKSVLAALHGTSENDPEVITEASAIKKDVQSRTKLSLLEQIKEVGSSKAMLYRCSIPMIVMAFGQLTGINAVNYYSPTIFKQLGLTTASAGLLGTGIYGIVKIIATILALALGVEQYGRKALIVWGGLGQAACMIFIGVYVLSHPHGERDYLTYLAIISLYVYITFFSFGWSVAQWPVMAECVPNHLRSLTMAFGMFSMWSTTILISKLTPIVLDKIAWGTYVIFGVATLFAVVWALLFYPETGGYAIEDIHDLFENVVKQSLHDNRYILRRPPVKRGYTDLAGQEEEGGEPPRRSFESATSLDRLL
ncbi:hypothetical protein FRB90_001752 [Tulasnella sp. 427]|nr:hypothetical protein FRB90_001752 [Tulasnella sp. 427]